jgi:outer membrane protein assembly factor BamB
VTRATTICCSAIALIAVIRGAGGASSGRDSTPFALVPTQPVWTLALNNQLTAPPAYDDRRVYFSIEYDRLAAYDLVSGKQLWLVEAKPTLQPAAGSDLVFLSEPEAIVARRAADGTVAWTAPLSDALAVRLVCDGGWLVAATQGGHLRTMRAADGATVWERDLGAPAHGAAALGGERLYVPAANGRIVALDVETGATVWERRVGGQPHDVLAFGDRLFVGSTDNYFYALLAKNGAIDWRWRTGGDVIGRAAADEHGVYFISLDNVVRSLNRVSGGQQWMRGLPLRPTSGPIIAGATLVVGGIGPALKTYNLKDGTPATDVSAGADSAAPPHAFDHPMTHLPMLLTVGRDLVKGATATLVVRSIDPAPTPIAPLPNAVTLAPPIPQ